MCCRSLFCAQRAWVRTTFQAQRSGNGALGCIQRPQTKSGVLCRSVTVSFVGIGSQRPRSRQAAEMRNSAKRAWTIDPQQELRPLSAFNERFPSSLKRSHLRHPDTPSLLFCHQRLHIFQLLANQAARSRQIPPSPSFLPIQVSLRSRHLSYQKKRAQLRHTLLPCQCFTSVRYAPGAWRLQGRSPIG